MFQDAKELLQQLKVHVIEILKKNQMILHYYIHEYNIIYMNTILLPSLCNAALSFLFVDFDG